MAILLVPSQYATIAQAMLAAQPTDVITLQTGYSNETATVTVNDITVNGGSSSTGIVLRLATGVPVFAVTGTAPIQIFDAADGNGITGNSGANTITVTGGADAVDGGLGVDRLVVDYHLATGDVTGDSTSNFTEAGAGGRSVAITNGTFEHFTVLTGSGSDTITTAGGDDLIEAGSGANTITAGQGLNTIYGGVNADTVTALDGGNFVDAGDGANTVTTGNGKDVILTGVGADTVVSGGGIDVTTVRGGADTVNSGAGNDRLIVDYSALTTNVKGSVSGTIGAGYGGVVGDRGVNSVQFSVTENFTITTGGGHDSITTGGGVDILTGGAGNDWLSSGAGNDRLFGGAGVDVLTGGGGVDRLDGGTGSDDFRFTSLSDSPTHALRDRISSFTVGADDIDLKSIDADLGVAGDQAYDFIGNSAFTGAGGEVRFSFVGGDTLVSTDTDGNSVADMVVQLDGHYVLGASDFIL